MSKQVQIFIPCYIDQFFPQTGLNMVKVLEKVGCKVHYNTEQTCCGSFLLNTGAIDECRELGIKFISGFNGKEPIVIPSGSCTGMIRNRYKLLFETSSYRYDYKATRKRVFEFTEYLTEVLKISSIPDASLKGKALYLHGCKSLRECGVFQGPLELLKSVKGLTIDSFESWETCCGFGGSFCMSFPKISSDFAADKIAEAEAKAVDMIISADLTCLMHLKESIKQKGSNIKVLHIADVLAS